MKTPVNVAVVGATGAVGEIMLDLLAARDFPVGEVFALASARSAGSKLPWRGGTLTVGDLSEFDFSQAAIGLFSAGAGVSREHAPRAVAAGCTVIDNTSQFRYDEDIPLIVPEVNLHALTGHRERGIIANPNCSTIQLVVALKPIHDAFGIRRINVCTYQAVSGSGRRAVEELASQSASLLNGRPVSPEAFPKQIAFNVLPHIDVFLENGYTKEEMKIVWETRKILGEPGMAINPTAVRVPVFYGHSEAVHLECHEPVSAAHAREILRKAPGVVVLDDPEKKGYPTPVTEGAGRDGVYVGRIREDISAQNGLDLWIVSDNTRKGAALNSIQIAEHLLQADF